MEHLLDWHLIYRDAPQMRELAALVADQGDVRVLSDPTGVNVFLEVRKPAP
jgi:extracellular factor (EF) 3-hydroxypalmitic acid methyl ester biosynthesis protein